MDNKKPVLTTSGSVQSHISVSLSKKRLRSYSLHCDSAGPPLPVTASRPHRRYRDGWNALVWLWNSLSNVYIRWIVVLYVCFSLAFLTSSLYSLSRPAAKEPYPLSLSKQLSRILPHHPTPTDFQPFFLRGTLPNNPHALTACMWSTDAIDVQLLLDWAQHWNGPISLVIATTSRHDLLDLDSLSSSPALSIHLLTANAMSPNVLLNLARLYSRTATVVLFPESLNALSHLDSAMLRYAHVRTPALLTSLPDLRFPMPSYTPLLLPQDHAFWCSERSFFVYSRALDWNECIWKVWLEERGRLGHLNVSTTSTLPDPIEKSQGQDKTRTRLTARYRSETCDLHLKRQTILEPASSPHGRRNINWIKAFCRQTTENTYRFP